MSGRSGPPVPEPVEQSPCLDTGAAAVLSPEQEEGLVLENRRSTMGLEFKSRDSPALSSPSAQVR